MKKFLLTIIIAWATIGQLAIAQNIVTITEKEFIEKVWDYRNNPDQFIYKGSKPCIVDFYADWCGPCRKLGTNLKTIAAKYQDQITIYKIDVDNKENANLVAYFRISSIPYILFANSKEIYNNSGLMSVEQLEEVVDAIIKENDK